VGRKERAPGVRHSILWTSYQSLIEGKIKKGVNPQSFGKGKGWPVIPIVV
jgi:hypothetical protein